MKKLQIFVLVLFVGVLASCTQKTEVAGAPGAASAPSTSEKAAEPGGEGATECVRWGCSSQFCGDPKEVSGAMSTCEWKEEYRCAQLMACGRDAEQKCTLTPTAESEKCFAEVKQTTPEI